jgi:D-alanine transaminase
LVDFNGHMVRLQRSLRELGFAYVPDIDEFLAIHRELVKRNDLAEGVVYVQVTRGTQDDRSFFYKDTTAPTIWMLTQAKTLVANPMADKGLSVISVPDLRWKRCDIKTTQLLYQAMGKMQAKAAGCDDAWMVDEHGFVTEGASNNAWIIKGQAAITTRQVGRDILPGITRSTVMRLLEDDSLAMEERPFTVAEAQEADEAFVTSSSNFVMPVVCIDGKMIGDGKPGPLSRKLREIYIEESRKAAT